MASDAVRKRCNICKRTLKGTRGKMQWCDCGGEMVAIPYNRTRRKVKRAS